MTATGRSGSSSSTSQTLTLFGPRKVLVDGGVHPEDKPVWAEGPHLYKRDGWYYLMAAEGGTAEHHSRDDLPLAPARRALRRRARRTRS